MILVKKANLILKKGFVETVGKAVMRKAANKVAAKIARGIFGGLLK